MDEEEAVEGECCALCPFGLTCQRFGMVWDGENAVGLNKLLFLYINVCFVHFVIIFSLGTLGVSHFVLSWGVPHSTVGAQHVACVSQVAVLVKSGTVPL